MVANVEKQLYESGRFPVSQEEFVKENIDESFPEECESDPMRPEESPRGRRRDQSPAEREAEFMNFLLDEEP